MADYIVNQSVDQVRRAYKDDDTRLITLPPDAIGGDVGEHDDLVPADETEAEQLRRLGVKIDAWPEEDDADGDD